MLSHTVRALIFLIIREINTLTIRVAAARYCLDMAIRPVSRAIKEQVKKGENFISILNEPAVNLAKKIERVIPSAEKIRFVTSGSDGTNLSLRLARAHTGKQKILKFEGRVSWWPRLRNVEL